MVAARPSDRTAGAEDARTLCPGRTSTPTSIESIGGRRRTRVGRRPTGARSTACPLSRRTISGGLEGRFRSTAYRGRTVRVHTSGSTGEPMVFFRSVEQESWFWALRLRMWTWAGYRLGEPYVTLNLNSRTMLRKRIQDVLFSCSYHGFNARSNDVAAVLADLRTARHLIGYASSLYLLSRAVPEAVTATLRLHSLLSTGDTLLPVVSPVHRVDGSAPA